MSVRAIGCHEYQQPRQFFVGITLLLRNTSLKMKTRTQQPIKIQRGRVEGRGGRSVIGQGEYERPSYPHTLSTAPNYDKNKKMN